jgi:hypothetical protein
VAGYCVEGTLAKHILTEPEEITTMNGQKLPLKMQVCQGPYSETRSHSYDRELQCQHCKFLQRHG